MVTTRAKNRDCISSIKRGRTTNTRNEYKRLLYKIQELGDEKRIILDELYERDKKHYKMIRVYHNLQKLREDDWKHYNRIYLMLMACCFVCSIILGWCTYSLTECAGGWPVVKEEILEVLEYTFEYPISYSLEYSISTLLN